MVVFAFLGCASKCRAALPVEEPIHLIEIAWGTVPDRLDHVVLVPGAANSHTLTGLPAGLVWVRATAISVTGVRSEPSRVKKIPIVPPADPVPMVRVHVYQTDLSGTRIRIATLYVPRKEKDFFQLGIETP
jgi:hypothetical protein